MRVAPVSIPRMLEMSQGAAQLLDFMLVRIFLALR
jgi:hypothetical protein